MDEVEGQPEAGSRPSRSWTPPDAAWTAPDARADPTPTSAAAERALGGPARPVGSEPPDPIPLRPMTPTAVFDAAFEVLKTRPRVLLGAAAVLVVPTQLLSLRARGGARPADLVGWLAALDEGTGINHALETRPAAVWATGLAEMLVTFLVGALVARTVAAWYAGRDPDVREVLRTGLGRPVALAGAFAGMALVQGLGSLVLCIGVVVPLVWYLPLAPTLAVEQLGGAAALRRSYQLASRRLASLLGVVVGMAFVDQVVRLSLEAVPWLLADQLPEVATLVVRTTLVVIVSGVSSVFIGAASTLVYFDLRVRTEGLDLELEATDAFALPR